MPENQSDTTPAPQVWPTLRARDARGLIRFLVEAFGFEETVVFGEGERVEHAQLSWPEGGGIMLGSVRGPRTTVGRCGPGRSGAMSSPTAPTSCAPAPELPARRSSRS